MLFVICYPYILLHFNVFYQPASRAAGWLVLRLLCGFRICVYICVHTYHVYNNYITYIVAMRSYFSRLRQFRQLLCVYSCYE